VTGHRIVAFSTQTLRLWVIIVSMLQIFSSSSTNSSSSSSIGGDGSGGGGNGRISKGCGKLTSVFIWHYPYKKGG
jgi:hypothetical protein